MDTIEIGVRELLDLWELQIQKINTLLELNSSFPDNEAFKVLNREFRLLNSLKESFDKKNILINTSIYDAIKKVSINE